MVVERLDAERGEPLWSQLATVLRRRLTSGQYKARFPTEMELTAEFAVSRATVREAIRRLREEGLLQARRGSGTFVVRRQLEQGLIGSPGLARMIAAAGLEEESEVRRLAEGPAGKEAAAALGLAPDATVVWVERLRSADGVPIALDRSALSLPADDRTAYLSAALERGSIYDALQERCHIQVTGAEERVRAVACGEKVRKLLQLGRHEGVLEVELVSYVGEEPIEWRVSLMRGSAYILLAHWGVVPAGPSRQQEVSPRPSW